MYSTVLLGISFAGGGIAAVAAVAVDAEIAGIHAVPHGVPVGRVVSSVDRANPVWCSPP
jgi:hypothetical protein